MEHIKNKVLVNVLIFLLALTMGCAITITRNQNYGYPRKTEDIADQNEPSRERSAETFSMHANERK